MNVPFFRPNIGEREIEEVVTCLRSGWLTTGPNASSFEKEFANYVGAKYAIALNSCTAALHLALEAVGVERGDVVVVPTMTFAATAEVVRYFDAIPAFVDCDATQCIDVDALEEILDRLKNGQKVAGVPSDHGPVRAVIPMHYGGQMANVDEINRIAALHGIAVIEDAAHTLPAFIRKDDQSPWRAAGTTSKLTCFSFYANKCITTGEGGMAVTDDEKLAERIRIMSLHGMSKDAWKRFTSAGSWYYEVVAPGFKYNITDMAAALGRVQLGRAEELWSDRKRVANEYRQRLASIPGLELPTELPDRRHSWHLFSLRLDLSVWRTGRDAFMDGLKQRGIGASVHWMPLHMQPYYRDKYGLEPSDYPTAASLWPRLVSLPIFPGMKDEELAAVVSAIGAMAAEL